MTVKYYKYKSTGPVVDINYYKIEDDQTYVLIAVWVPQINSDDSVAKLTETKYWAKLVLDDTEKKDLLKHLQQLSRLEIAILGLSNYTNY